MQIRAIDLLKIPFSSYYRPAGQGFPAIAARVSGFLHFSWPALLKPQGVSKIQGYHGLFPGFALYGVGIDHVGAHVTVAKQAYFSRKKITETHGT